MAAITSAEPVHIEWEWTVPETDSDAALQLFRAYDAWYEDQGEYKEDGVLLNTIGWSAQSNKMKQVLVFEDQNAQLAHAANTWANYGLFRQLSSYQTQWNPTGKIMNGADTDLVNEIWPLPEADTGYVDIYGYGPHVHGVLNSPAPAGSTDGQLMVNLAFKAKDKSKKDVEHDV